MNFCIYSNLHKIARWNEKSICWIFKSVESNVIHASLFFHLQICIRQRRSCVRWTNRCFCHIWFVCNWQIIFAKPDQCMHVATTVSLLPPSMFFSSLPSIYLIVIWWICVNVSIYHLIFVLVTQPEDIIDKLMEKGTHCDCERRKHRADRERMLFD